MADKEWAGTTFGNRWMHKWLIRLTGWMDVRILYAFTSLFIVPATMLVNKSSKIIYSYFRERHGHGVWRAAWSTYVNHCLFSQVVIDRFAMYAGKKFHIETEGYDNFLQLARQKEGFIQLSSHIGNYEIAGYTLVAEEKPFNALVFFGQVLDNGETLSMPADRIFGSQKSVSVSFLGAPAEFPLGPFIVATMRGLDALAVNVMKTSSKGYKIYVTPLSYNKEAPRKQQIAELVQSYVQELERMLKIYPAQWYNFFDFWK